MLVLVSVSAVLILLVLPFAGVRFGLLDHRTLPADHPVAETAEQLAADFPGAAEDPITVVIPERDATPVGESELGEYAARLSALPGVAVVETATGRYVDGQTTPTTGPQAEGLKARYTSAAGVWVAVTASAADPADARSVVRDLRDQPAPGRCWWAGRRPRWSMRPTRSPTG
ncbi:hypothetical protein [Nocardioides aequoreus]|uniref:hypothetical protein n=1 Tax=Nocardioides aequoreus TaxID=397278 RepID=UPI000A47DE39|nr:hypothetical protein [Nocardioides aequoreus]